MSMKTAMSPAYPCLVVLMLSLFSVTSSSGQVYEKTILCSSLTPLQLAAIEGRSEDVENILLKKKEPVDGQTSGLSPLHWAALRGQVPVIRILLRFGADTRSLDEEQNTPLHLAAVSGSTDAVQELIRAKSDLNAQNRNSSTALHMATAKQHFEVVQKLLRFGALTNITDQQERSAFDIAYETNNLLLKTMELFQSAGAEIIKYARLYEYEKARTIPSTTTMASTTTTRPPKATRIPELRRLTENEMKLHEAAQKSLDEKIVDLCAEGVDPNVADIQNNGYTPLHLAAGNNRKLAILALVRCSANLNAKDFDGNTPLHIAILTNYPWAFDFLQILGANPDIKNNAGKLPKDLAVEGKKSGFQASFIPERTQWFRDIRPLTDKEENLLRLVRGGYYMTVADACKEGVDVRVKDVNHKQYTALHYAVSVKANVLSTIQMLLRCGADINARDADGNTPLHLAAMEKAVESQNTLLLNGADPFIANNEGKAAYEIIKASSPENIDSRLRWYMVNTMPL